MSCPSRSEFDDFQSNRLRPEQSAYIRSHTYKNGGCDKCKIEIDWISTYQIPADFLQLIIIRKDRNFWEWFIEGGSRFRAFRDTEGRINFYIFSS